MKSRKKHGNETATPRKASPRAASKPNPRFKTEGLLGRLHPAPEPPKPAVTEVPTAENLTALYGAMLDALAPEDVCAAAGVASGSTWMQVAVARHVKLAASGDSAAIRDILNRMAGKSSVVDPHDFAARLIAANGDPVAIRAITEELDAALKQVIKDIVGESESSPIIEEPRPLMTPSDDDLHEAIRRYPSMRERVRAWILEEDGLVATAAPLETEANTRDVLVECREENAQDFIQSFQHTFYREAEELETDYCRADGFFAKWQDFLSPLVERFNNLASAFGRPRHMIRGTHER